MLKPDVPALVLAPMEGITDAPMRALMGAHGAFDYAVSEFLRVSIDVLPGKVFKRDIPELNHDAVTPTGLPVQVQLLGGDAGRMAASAVVACEAGAKAIDINFGCPAPTVNRHDGGASLLRAPCRIREVVAAVRAAVPADIPVSAKLRLGWDTVDAVYENAAMAAEGGASWLTIHARTRVQGYLPPVYWKPIGFVRESLKIPVIANGDIWTVDDFRQCREETGCIHFMLGRCALARPELPQAVARVFNPCVSGVSNPCSWRDRLRELVRWTEYYEGCVPRHTVKRMKQWLSLAARYGEFEHFDLVKRAETVDELFQRLPA